MLNHLLWIIAKKRYLSKKIVKEKFIFFSIQGISFSLIDNFKGEKINWGIVMTSQYWNSTFSFKKLQLKLLF